MNRLEQLQKIKECSAWDVVVIGGGASGLGAALDAASRGFKTLLLEAFDFAKGTSSRSTKLIHGGVRYLAQGDVKLVREALRERGLLSKNASHLAKTQKFIIPNYSYYNGLFYTVGLNMYDLLSGKLSLGHTKFLSAKNVKKRLVNIDDKHLRTGVEYTDGQFDDSRLSVNLAQTIIEHDGVALNYCRVTALNEQNGKLTGVKFVDVLTNEEYEVSAKSIINATGVFTNDIFAMENKHIEAKPVVVPSQGIHLVLDRSFLPSEDALMIPKTSDGRVMFALPWHDKTIVGTTDTLIKDISYEPRALEEEIEFLLKSCRQYLVKAPQRSDVLSVFAGLRPLAAPKEGSQKTKEISRSHKILTSDKGLVSIIGGKWTTYRKIAEDAVDAAIKASGLDNKKCITEDLPIHGKIAGVPDLSDYLYVYGTDKAKILELEQQDPTLAEKIHPNYPYTKAQVMFAAKEEMAQSVEDVLARRVRILFFDARASIEAALVVAEVLASYLGKDKAWIDAQVSEYTELARGYYLA